VLVFTEISPAGVKLFPAEGRTDRGKVEPKQLLCVYAWNGNRVIKTCEITASIRIR